MKRQSIQISQSEWQVMKAIWSSPPKSLGEILNALEPTAWSTTTIQTYLARLVKKGALSTERQGKGYLYSPTISEAQCQLAQSTVFLNRMFDGSLASMVSGFIKNGSLSDEELRKLKAMLEEQENDNADHR